MNIAIITGASSGLGKEFVKAIIEKYENINEIWLIARREERLKQLTMQYTNIKFKLLVLDLSKKESFSNLSRILKEENPIIQILINNAGFEKEGRFDEMPITDIISIINLNIMGMTLLNSVCLPYMKSKSFEIITGSISSFAPIPAQAVYSASKSYVKFFARALSKEMEQKDINIMLFNPGNIDTEMNVRKNINERNAKIALLPYLNIEKETRKALKKAQIGKKVYTPLFFYKGYRLLGKIIPSVIMMRFTTIEK